MWEFDSEFAEIIQRTPNIKSFRFPIRGKDVRYDPGQFFFLTIKIRGEDATHHFSFSSSPTEKGYIEFTKRITASQFSQALDVMRAGTWAHLKGPGGDFTLPPNKRKMVLICGGIGITPLRSMLRYTVDRKLSCDIVLLYGNNTYEDIAFRDEIDEMGRSYPGIRIEHVLAGPQFPPVWKGRRGLINKDLVSEAVPDFLERLYYVSGPPRMVMAVEGQLTALAVPGEQIKRDSFLGYE